MALRAGLVGVNPKGVDKNGMPKVNGVDAYTKAQTDSLLSAKVDKSTLTANSKEFNFAYDETTEKYGYKAGDDGEFVPFEQAGADGINLSDPIMTGITPNTGTIEDVAGGYMVIDSVYYLHITAKLKIAISGGHELFSAFISNFDASYSDTNKKVYVTNGTAKCNLYRASGGAYTVSNASGTFHIGDIVDIVGVAF